MRDKINVIIYSMTTEIPGIKTDYKNARNTPNKGNVFDRPAAIKSRLRQFMRIYNIRSQMHLARLLGVQNGTTVWRWLHTPKRPNARFTSRLLQLSLWVAEHRLVLSDVEYVDWEIPVIVFRGRTSSEPRRYLSPRDWTYLPDNKEPEGHGPIRLRP